MPITCLKSCNASCTPGAIDSMPKAITIIVKASATNTIAGTSDPIPLLATVLSIVFLLFF